MILYKYVLYYSCEECKGFFIIIYFLYYSCEGCKGFFINMFYITVVKDVKGSLRGRWEKIYSTRAEMRRIVW